MCDLVVVNLASALHLRPVTVYPLLHCATGAATQSGTHSGFLQWNAVSTVLHPLDAHQYCFHPARHRCLLRCQTHRHSWNPRPAPPLPQYPIGGDTMSVTSGVVSRIEVTSYVHGAAELLGIQIDAAVSNTAQGSIVSGEGLAEGSRAVPRDLGAGTVERSVFKGMPAGSRLEKVGWQTRSRHEAEAWGPCCLFSSC